MLCSPDTMNVAAVVELDDTSHNDWNRADRDRFVDGALVAAGVPGVRVKAKEELVV